ncbi:MAG: hypothetical protein E6I73_06535 [Chloroflexi bacterium]|nr:MAG: hypothetical protein E6I73_06535 [Chloroflexota bacterium]
MKGWAALALGATRLVVAAGIILALAYVLSWQILWGGMAGAEAPFHLHLIEWVATTFPNLPWWYPWDGMGVSYREAYPLASHWLAVAASHVFSTSLQGGAQIVQFALMPLSALGLYAFFDWRLRRPLAGVAASILFLISPLPWVEWAHFGLFASWVGLPVFMPVVIALDVFFHAWLSGDRSWRIRAGAGGYIGLTTLMGIVSPHLLAAPLLVAPAYALAIPHESARRAWRWILAVVPMLWIGVALLSIFWLGAEIQYLGVVRSHWAGAGTNFDINRLSPIPLSDVLSLSMFKPADLGSLYSLSPAVLLPALLGAAVAFRDTKARAFLAIAVVSIVFMTFRDLYRPLFVVPGFAEFAITAHRPFQLLASFAVPTLAAIGLLKAPLYAMEFLARRLRSYASLRSFAVPAVAVVVVSVFVADVLGFAGRVEGGSRLAYGPSLATPGWAPDLNDIWERHTSAPLVQQLLDPRQWRAPGVGCDLDCPGRLQSWSKLGATFASPPARAELNSNVAQLDMAFHMLVGGGITHSYNDQVIPSRELASWMEESMLVDSGSTTKAQLAAALGIDAVVLSKTQAARTADYLQMGWVQVGSDPVALVNPQPSGLAAQWQSGTSVLVVGRTQASVPALYNFVFERATTGLLPFASAWLVRSASPYIDDYSDADLSHYSGLILLGYQYRDQGTAWSRLDRYVRGGGHLFIETGWQYVDPDWDLGSAPAVLPVASVRWSALDASERVQVDGAGDPQFGRFVYGSGGWGASSASSVKQGATELVRVGDRVVAARWHVGGGRVLWSGMNLMAHDATSGSPDEDQFVAAQLAWLFGPSAEAGPQVAIPPAWDGGDQVTIALQPSVGPSLVMLKESFFPGWTARLVTPKGSTSVDLLGTEMDFMLARLDSVPPGSNLVFTYGPTAFEETTWVVSLLTLAGLILWLVRPAFIRRGRDHVIGSTQHVVGNLFGGLARSLSPSGEDP